MYRDQFTLKKVLKGLLFLVVLSILISVLFFGSPVLHSLKYFIFANTYGFTVGLAFWMGNWTIGIYIRRKLNWKKDPVKSNIIALSVFFTYGILISFLLAYLFEKYFFRNNNDGLIRAVMLNSFINLAIDLVFVSLFYSLYIVRYWHKSIQNEEELKRENLAARYEALKNQVNPHFLFNSLNTLSGIVETDQRGAVHYIKRLSDTYRYVLEQRDKELVTIEEELCFVNDYLYMARIRYGKGLIVRINLLNVNSMLAPLGLQLLIENSIKHNIITDDEPLTIDIYSRDGYIIVSNNLQPKKVVQDNSPLGLETLRKRYAYLTDSMIIIESDKHTFTVKIPMIKDHLNELPDY